MALLDKIKKKAVKEVNDSERQEKWVEKGFDSAIKEARDLVPSDGEEGSELKALADTANLALDKLEAHRSAIVGLGRNGLRSTVTMLGMGQFEGAAQEAALLKLRTTSGWDDVTSTLLNTAEAGNEAKRKLDAEFAELKSVLGDIGLAAAKAVLPFLLAVL